MSRSSWKPKFIHNEIATQYANFKVNGNADIVSVNRATYLTEHFIGHKIHVYNGMRFYSIVVSSDMLGHCLGEFSPTRKKPVPKKKKTTKKK